MGCDMSMHDNSDRQEQIREQAMRQWEEEQAREQEDLTRPAMVALRSNWPEAGRRLSCTA